MADLETAAAVLVKKITDFGEDVQQADTRFDELRKKLEEAEEELDEEWSSFVEAAQALLRSVEEGGEPLAKDAEEAVNALGELGEAIGEKAGQAERHLSENDALLDALRQQAEALEPDIEKMAEEAGRKPLEGLGEQLEEVKEAVEQSLEGGGNVLREAFVEHAQQGVTMVEMLSDGCVKIAADDGARLDAAFIDWAGKLAEAGDEVHVNGFNKAEAHAAEVVDWAMDKCEETHREHLERLGELMDKLREELEALGEEVKEKDRQLERAAQKAGGEFGELVAALDRANGALEQTTELLQAHGYMG